MDNWFDLLKEHIQANGGDAFAPETCSRNKVHNPEMSTEGKEELRNSISKEPIYEWEGSQRDSLGQITYVSKVRLQHLPCQEQDDRLLVMYPNYLIILSEECDGLFYKGKLPLNMIQVTTPCQDVKPNTFMIEGKLINPIVVSCPNTSEFREWLQHFKAADIPVLSPPPPVYDIIYTPTKKEAPETRWSSGSPGSANPPQQSAHSSRELQLPRADDDPFSPGYAEPICYISSRPTSVETQYSAWLGSRSNSVSSQTKPEPRAELRPELRPASLRYSSAQQASRLSSNGRSSPIYNTPYNGTHRSTSAHRLEKAPLVKSNSWSTPAHSLKYSLSVPQRHSDMVSGRKPLSPLYDEPPTPGMDPQEEDPVKAVHSSWSSVEQQCPPLLPASFRLCTPPLGRRSRAAQTQEPERSSSQWGAEHLVREERAEEQRAQAVARLKLLPAPNPPPPPAHSHGAPRSYPGLATTETTVINYSLSPDENCYLEPVEPDDQEIDYDNIWEYDCNNGMTQTLPGISPHWTEPDFDAPGLGAMVTQKRWS